MYTFFSLPSKQCEFKKLSSRGNASQVALCYTTAILLNNPFYRSPVTHSMIVLDRLGHIAEIKW